MLYVFESPKWKAKIHFENPDWKCLKLWFPWGECYPLRTLWHNLHMFLDILEFSVGNKQKNCVGKTVLRILSQIWERMAYVSTKLLLEKSTRLSCYININLMNVLLPNLILHYCQKYYSNTANCNTVLLQPVLLYYCQPYDCITANCITVLMPTLLLHYCQLYC